MEIRTPTNPKANTDSLEGPRRDMPLGQTQTMSSNNMSLTLKQVTAGDERAQPLNAKTAKTSRHVESTDGTAKIERVNKQI